MTPTLGYPSRSAAIRALHQDGLTNAQIAARLGMRQNTVAVHLHRLRQEGSLAAPNLSVAPGILTRLRSAATARGLTGPELAGQLLTAIARYDLTDAILED